MRNTLVPGIQHRKQGTVHPLSQQLVAAVHPMPEDGLRLIKLAAHPGVLRALAGEQKGYLGRRASGDLS